MDTLEAQFERYIKHWTLTNTWQEID